VAIQRLPSDAEFATEGCDLRLGPAHRCLSQTQLCMTAWRRVQEVIAAAGIPDGPHACPKGLRHGFGVQAVSKGIALNMVQKWLGHAQLTRRSMPTPAARRNRASPQGCGEICNSWGQRDGKVAHIFRGSGPLQVSLGRKGTELIAYSCAQGRTVLTAKTSV
jgi:hypothetical protein